MRTTVQLVLLLDLLQDLLHRLCHRGETKADRDQERLLGQLLCNLWHLSLKYPAGQEGLGTYPLDQTMSMGIVVPLLK